MARIKDLIVKLTFEADLAPIIKLQLALTSRWRWFKRWRLRRELAKAQRESK